MMMRVIVDHFIDGDTSLGSPGLGPMRWKLPVRPGDVLRVRARVTGNRRSASKPDRGTVTFEVDVLNQNGETVMTVENWIAIMRARPAAAAEASRAARRRTRASRRSTSSAAVGTCATAPMPWPEPQMSRHAFVFSDAKLIFDGSLSGRLSGSSPARSIEARR